MSKKSIFSVLRSVSSYFSLKEGVEPFRINTYEKVHSFIYNGDYTNYRAKKVFLQNEPLEDKVIAKKMNISEAGVRVARKRISEDAYSVIGENFADKIMYGTERECFVLCDNIDMLQYMLSTRDYIFGDVLDVLSDAYIGDGVSTFKLNECKNEMLLLSMFTLNRFTSLVDKVDSEKLNYLIRLLKNDVSNTDDRIVALKYINSLKNTSDLCKFLQS